MASARKLTLPNGKSIPYQLERRSRKTLGLKITASGLTVHAPKLLLVRQIEAILQEKSRWIQEKLAKQALLYVPPIAWENDEALLFLGRDIFLNIVQHNRNKVPSLTGDKLNIALTDPEPVKIQHKVTQWYQKQATTDFARRLALFASQLGVPTPPLKLSNAKTRWGSCNSRGVIRLSWRLMQAPPEMINYVVCHELAHLKEMNHSPRFYAVLSSLLPEHRRLETALDQLTPQLKRL